MFYLVKLKSIFFNDDIEIYLFWFSYSEVIIFFLNLLKGYNLVE